MVKLKYVCQTQYTDTCSVHSSFDSLKKDGYLLLIVITMSWLFCLNKILVLPASRQDLKLYHRSDKINFKCVIRMGINFQKYLTLLDCLLCLLEATCLIILNMSQFRGLRYSYEYTKSSNLHLFPFLT